MSRTGSVDKTIRQYLLGELSEPEQAAIESEYFADKERFEEVCALENDLIDDYVSGNLPAAEREQFERRYLLSPEKFRRIQFAGTMLSSLSGVPGTAGRESAQRVHEPPGFWTSFATILGRWRLRPSPALASLILILIAMVVVLGLECLRLRGRLTESRQMIASTSQNVQDLERQLSDQSTTSSQLAKELDILRSPPVEPSGPPVVKSPVVATFTLRFGLIRGTAEPQSLAVAPGAKVIELRIDLKSVDFKKYSANLTTPEGTLVWKQAQVGVRPSPQSGGRIAIRLPARLLPPGDYILRVDGMNPGGESVELGDSYFRVVRKAAP